MKSLLIPIGCVKWFPVDDLIEAIKVGLLSLFGNWTHILLLYSETETNAGLEEWWLFPLYKCAEN